MGKMKNTTKKLHFTLQFTHPTKHFSLCIVSDGEVVHQITNLMSFSKAIGYPDLTQKVFGSKSDIAKDAALLTEFNEAELSKDADANIVDLAVDACCQHKITEYLFENSEPFRQKYDEYYASLIGTCKSFSLINNEKCTHCIMRPN